MFYSDLNSQDKDGKVIEGQIAILSKLRQDFESMLTPMPTMAMAG